MKKGDKLETLTAESGDATLDPALESKSVATVDRGGALAIVGGYDAEDLGKGFEDITIDDLTIPFLAILQSGNPQVKKDKGVYIPGAEPGMLFNTVTQEIFDGKEGVLFIPVHRIHKFIEWIPRDQGGGLVSVLEPTDEQVVALRKENKFGKMQNGEGNEVVETFTVYGLAFRPNGTYIRAALSFSSSNIKHYKRWMTTAMNVQIPVEGRDPITPPLFAHAYRVRTQFVEKGGNDWYQYQIGFENGTAEASRLATSDNRFIEAKKFRGEAVAGGVQLDYEKADRGDDAEDGGVKPGDNFEM